MYKKILFIITFFFLFGLSSKVYAYDISGYQTPLNIISDDDASRSAFPLTWTAKNYATVTMHGNVWTLPVFDDVIDGFLYKFTITSSSAGWSFLPNYSNDSGVTWYSVGSPCTLSNTVLGYPCQYNTINGTSTNTVISWIPSTLYTISREKLADGTLWFRWRTSPIGATRNITITNVQIAVVYHSASSPATTFSCPPDWLLSDICTLLGGLVVPDTTLFQTQYSALQASASAKFPFAYITAITNLDWAIAGLSATGGALPSFSIPINPSVVLPNVQLITFTPTIPEIARPIFTWLRTATTLILWGIFIGYLITVVRRFF